MNEQIVTYAGSMTHFAQHLIPIYQSLPDSIRGPFYARGRSAEYTYRKGVDVTIGVPRRAEMVLCASYEDYRSVKPSPVILLNHGVGQRYTGDSSSADHPSYSGGRDRERVVLHLCPSERDAETCRSGGADACAVGVPRLDKWHGDYAYPLTQERPVVAVSFHADIHVCPETRSAFAHYRDALISLARDQGQLPFTLLGHAHPRWTHYLAKFWKQIGIEFVEDFDEVLDRADCYVIDNSCVSPDTPVLCDDLIWRPAQDLRPGDRVISCEEERTRPQRHPSGKMAQREARRFTTSEVLSNQIRLMPTYQVATTHGVLTVSSKHPWLTRKRVDHHYMAKDQRGREYPHTSYSATWAWKSCENLRVGDQVAFLVEPWKIDESREAGWLAGIFDGEGCIHIAPSRESGSRQTHISIAQNEGWVLDEIFRLLAEKKIDCSDRAITGRRNCRKVTLKGWLADRLRFLGSIRPERLTRKATDKAFWEGCHVSQHVEQAEVLAIEYLGLQEVCVMATSDKTFVAGGFLAHNSTLYEFASTGRPVLTLNAPWYRRDVHHGLRFWEAIPGLQVDSPDNLLRGIKMALNDGPTARDLRRQAVRVAYDDLCDSHATQRATSAIESLVASL